MTDTLPTFPEPRAWLAPQTTTYRMFVTYRTRGVFHVRDGVRHQSATVIGHAYDYMGRLQLVVRYSDGREDLLTRHGRTGLGYDHVSDLTMDVLPASFTAHCAEDGDE